jgi:hypothetical protein
MIRGKFTERETIDKHKKYYRYFYETGEIYIEGMKQDSLREGLWKKYYIDGTLCSEAIFYKGEVENLQQISKNNVVFEFENNPSEIKAGNVYYYRITMHGVWNFSIDILQKELGRIDTIAKRDDFPFRINPQVAGTATMQFQVRDSEDNIIKTIPYVITVVE